ncbi:phosphatase PAP2 family protein [Asanoa ferruginea]|uniref:phosphatase PAP2 family protein n=1 Tax=Asanoa ferruginea TaxID=53367 RepID=UPI001476C615|nr:phosphatase PAP2 family protein [Asanoa ferruginea]
MTAIVFAGLTIAVAAHAGALIHADAALVNSARSASLDHPALHSLMAALTRTGGSAVLILAGLVTVAALLAGRLWRAAAFVVVAAVSTTAVRWAVRAAVARPRPAEQLAPAEGWAYPSGHTTSSTLAALVAVALLLRLVDPGPRRSAGIAVVTVWAVGVGLSRVFLAVHWPTDVIGGWLLAATVVPLCAVAIRLRD